MMYIDAGADVVVACLGINDIMLDLKNAQTGHVRKEMARRYGALLAAPLSSKQRTRPRHVIMVSLPPLVADDRRKKSIRKAAALVPAVEAALADALTTAANPRETGAAGSQLHLVNISSGFDAETMLYDGLHPSERGEEHIARLIAPTLRKVLRIFSDANCGR
jgi:lysophospholipase L1-like esterase